MVAIRSGLVVGLLACLTASPAFSGGNEIDKYDAAKAKQATAESSSSKARGATDAKSADIPAAIARPSDKAGQAAASTSSRSGSSASSSTGQHPRSTQTSGSSHSVIANASTGAGRSSATGSASASPARGNAGASSDGSGFEAVEDEPIAIDFSGIVDEDGVGKPSFQWQIKDKSDTTWQNITGSINNVFTPSQQHVGKQLRVVLRYKDGKGELEEIISPATDPVINVNDAPVGLPVILGKATEKQILTSDFSTVFDEDGVGNPSFSWQKSVDGESWVTIEGKYGNLPLKQEHVGFYIRSAVRYVDGFGQEELLFTAATGVVQNVNDPVEGAPTLVGNPIEGNTLKVINDQLTDRDGIHRVYVQWEASKGGGWVQVPGASGDTLTLSSSLAGSQVRAFITVIDNFGVEEGIPSPQLGPVVAVNSRPTGSIIFQRVRN